MDDFEDGPEVAGGLMEDVIDSSSPGLEQISGGSSHYIEGSGPDDDEPSADDYVDDYYVDDFGFHDDHASGED